MGEFTEVVERRMRVEGVPVVRAENVAGSTRVRVGSSGEVMVRATKRAQADSQDRARRLLENLEVQIEQRGDEIRVSHRAFLVERGWLSLFRDRRISIDYEIEVPPRADVSARAASGDVEMSGLEGVVDAQTVSGEIRLDDVRGALRVRTVSGDCELRACAGRLESKSVSGDLSIEGSAFGMWTGGSVSGDVEAALRIDGDGPFSVKSVSGDLAITTPSAVSVAFRTVSGEARVDGGAHIERASRREFRLSAGQGGPLLEARTVSGDLSLRTAAVDAPAAPQTIPTPPPPPAPEEEDRGGVMELLDRLARGEIDVDEAGRLLDERR